MEQDASRRRHLPPRSGSMLDLAASQRRNPSTSLVQSPPTAARVGVSASLGSRSVSDFDYASGFSSNQMPSSPLAPSLTTGGGASARTWVGVGGNSGAQVRSFSQTTLGASSGAWAGIGGNSGGKVRSFSQTSLGAGSGARAGVGGISGGQVQSFSQTSLGAGSGLPSSYQLPPSSLGPTPTSGGGAARHARSFSKTNLGSRPSNIPIPPSPRNPMFGGGAVGNSSTSSHTRTFSVPPLFSSALLDSGRLPRQNAYADPAMLSSSPRAPPQLSFLDQGRQAPPASACLQPRTPHSEATTLLASSKYELAPLPPSVPHVTVPVKREEEHSDASANVSSGDVVILDEVDDRNDIDIVSHYIDLDGLCGAQNSDEVIKQEPDVPTTGGQPCNALAAGSGDDRRGKAAKTDTCCNCNTIGCKCSTSKLPTFVDIETKPKLPLLSKWSAGDGGSSSRSSMCRSRSVTAIDARLLVMGFADGYFTADEIKKIMAEERLKELVVSNPKRVKKILRNRLTAKLSKERRIQHMVNLERKIKVLEKEADTLSAQVQSLQKKSDELTSENNELKIKLQGMQQQTKLTNALNEAITAEVNHLKWAASGINGCHYIQEEQLQIQNQSSQPQQAQEPIWHFDNDVMQNILRADFI